MHDRGGAGGGRAAVRHEGEGVRAGRCSAEMGADVGRNGRSRSAANAFGGRVMPVCHGRKSGRRSQGERKFHFRLFKYSSRDKGGPMCVVPLGIFSLV